MKISRFISHVYLSFVELERIVGRNLVFALHQETSIVSSRVLKLNWHLRASVTLYWTFIGTSLEDTSQ